MKFGYQSEKFSAARSALMLPHPRGESESIAMAFHACYLGLRDLDRDCLGENARDWVLQIEALMDTTGLSSSDSSGLWAVKANLLTEEQKSEFSRAVDELADYFCIEFWQANSE
jgi:hypothetical protein